MMKRLIALAVPMLVLAAHPAQAVCSLAQPPNMNLGTYRGLRSDTGTISMSVTCPAGSANYTIPINGGSSGSTANRTMRFGTIILNYALFRDAARTQNWGNIANTDTYQGSGSTASIAIPVYPRIAAGQLRTPGTYTDTVSTGTRTFTISATILATCTVSATALNFGNYASAVLDASSVVTVTCTNTTAFGIGLSAGNAPGATVTARRMAGPSGALISYGLFRDAARTQNWGITASVDTQSGTGTGSALGFPVYGRVPASQGPTPGSYTDVITATITY